MPPVLAASPDDLVEGYGADGRIAHGTGAIVAAGEVAPRCAALLAQKRIAFVDMPSAWNNRFQARARRAARGATGAARSGRGRLGP